MYDDNVVIYLSLVLSVLEKRYSLYYVVTTDSKCLHHLVLVSDR